MKQPTSFDVDGSSFGKDQTTTLNSTLTPVTASPNATRLIRTNCSATAPIACSPGAPILARRARSGERHGRPLAHAGQ